VIDVKHISRRFGSIVAPKDVAVPHTRRDFCSSSMPDQERDDDIARRDALRVTNSAID
jgi:hypothetical protein